MPPTDPIWRFNPSRTDPVVREKIFVQRHELADNLMERIRDSALTGNRHHLLLIGPRGIGKTHLVALLRHRIDDDAEVRDRLRVAWLNEDESSTSFLDLLLRILRALGNEYPDEFNASVEPVYETGSSAAEEVATQLLLKQLGTHTLLVIVENLDDLFDSLGDEGQKRWRSFLQEHSVTATLATAQQIFKGVQKRENPFFGFFQIEYLKPLTVGEAVELLCKVAEVHEDPELLAFLHTTEGRARVRALHHLSGGNHRIYVVLSEFINHESLDALVPPFEKMLDELTPYYQERLRALSAQQRRIVEFLCTCERPVPVKEIAKRLFMTEQTAASQLKILKAYRYVISHSRGRESLYELTEPLMRLSFEVKENRRGPVRLIVDFLRVWYRPDQLQERLEQLDSTAILEREYLEDAIALAKNSEDPRLVAIQEDLAQAEREGRLEEKLLILEEQAVIKDDARSWFELGYWRDESKRYEEALNAYDRALEIDPNHAFAWHYRCAAIVNLKRYEEALDAYDKALEIDPYNVFVWNNRGVALNDLKRYEEALTAFDKALEIDPNHPFAWYNRGVALKKLKRYEEALNAYDKALEIDPNDAFTWNNRGVALSNLKRYEEALTACDKALEIDPNYAIAWNNRGNTLRNLKRYEEALTACDIALAVDPNYARAWNNRGLALRNLKRYEEALTAYNKALEIDPNDALAWNNRGITLDNLKRYEEALTAYNKALEIDPNYTHAWNNRGIALRNLKRHEEALTAFDKALEIDPNFTLAWNNRGYTLHNLKRYEEGLTAYDKTLKIDPNNAVAWNNRGVVLDHLKRYEEALMAYDKSISADTSYSPPRFNRVEVLWNQAQWNEGFAALQLALQRFWPNESDGAGSLDDMITIIAESSTQPSVWKDRVSRLVEIYSQPGLMGRVGDGLVRSLAKLDVKMLSEAALEAWREVWFEVGKNHDEMQVPLRIFAVGIQYLKTQDRRVLFDLIQTERRILEEALGLTPTES